MRGDTRAISPAVTQALTIGISTILITGLLVGGSTFVDAKQDSTVRQGLQDVGSGVASDLVRLDQFSRTSDRSTISFTSDYPDRVGSEGYEIRLVPDSGVTKIYVNSTSSELWTVVRFANTQDVCASSVSGGQIAVVYDTTESPSCLEVREV